MQQQQQQVVADKQLLDRVTGQWNPGLSLLNYYNMAVPPRQPMTIELTHFPSRSKYYETFLCTWTFAFSILLIHSIEYLAGTACRGRGRQCFINNRRTTALQFLLLVVPFQICVLDFPVKMYANFVLPFNAACLLCYLGCLVHKRLSGGQLPTRLDNSLEAVEKQQTPHSEIPMQSDSAKSNSQQRRPVFNDLLSIYRSIVYISTAVCVFARDQPCWNNDFSKTYSFGTGLMDVGIGCFVICIGSLGPTAIRRIENVDRFQALRKAALQAGILTACGVVKTLTVVIATKARGIRFEESWREYGVHWNAFYSLAVARLFGTCLELLLLPRRCPPLLAAAALAAAHEALLSMGLAEFVLAPGAPEPHNRSNLIGQNREGLASVLGLLTLYLAGLQLGRWARDWTVAEDSGTAHRAVVRIAALLAGALAWRPVVAHSGGAVLPESRRLVNPSYCAWVLAFSCFCILFAALGLWAQQRLATGGQLDDEAHTEGHTPLHLRQVDSAGLLYFLVSNLLTGLFNFLIDLISSNRESLDGPACFLIISVYTVAVFWVTRLAETKLSFRALQEKLMKRFCS